MQEPNRPALTPAQIAAAVIALIVPVATFLRAFGVYDLTPTQQSAVNGLILALAAFAAVLVTADAYLRGKRNDAHAKVAAVAAVKRNETPKALTAHNPTGEVPGGGVPPEVVS